MAIDIITGKVFTPKFKGQRTAVDLEAIMSAGGLTAEEAVGQVLNERYKGNIFYQAGRSDLQADHDRMFREARLTDPNAVRHVVTDAEVTEAAGRIGKLSSGLMGQLSGGGANAFLRTQSGLENWRAMVPDGEGGLQPAGYGIDPRTGRDYNRAEANPDWRAGSNGTRDVWQNVDTVLGSAVVGSADGTGVVQGDPTIPTMGDPDGSMNFDGADEGEDFSLGDFVGALVAIGIPNNMAVELWDWGQEMMLDATYPVENLVVDIYEQPAFKARFPAIDAMTGRDDVRPISPKDYLIFEEDVKELLTRYSVGGQKINFDSLITSLLTNTVGTGEVEQRLVAAKRVLGNVPEEVKQTYMAWYGPGVAEENLMKTFLDPNDEWGGSWADVEAEVKTSEVGGWTRQRLGLEQSEGLFQQTAADVAALGLQEADIWQRLDALKSQEKLFSEKLGEEDLAIQREGVEAGFGLDFDAAEALERRRATRIGEFSGGGGAMLTGATTGYGAANA